MCFNVMFTLCRPKIFLIILERLTLQKTQYFSQNFQIGQHVNLDLIASEPHVLRSIA